LDNISVGAALCGSFCTYGKTLPLLEKLREHFGPIQPIMSEISQTCDTRFGKVEEFVDKIVNICGKPLMGTIGEVEPIGPQKLLDVLLIVPATGNTIAKIAAGIADTPVTMAVKSHLRNERPVVVAVSTNDGLGANAKNIGALLARKHIYFVPFYQDDPTGKPNSLLADMDRVIDTVELAMGETQIQPLLLQKK